MITVFLRGAQMLKNSFLVTIPHSGEKIPPQTPWLLNLPETKLMCDVDRFVDRLYEPALEALKIPWVKTEWHRYAADLNRIPADVDETSVLGSKEPAGKFNRGFHWVETTLSEKIMHEPMSFENHQKLVELIYKPFHESIEMEYEKFKLQGFEKIFHLDAHSMPSKGTKQHRDPGELRADIVVSDCHGMSCSKEFRDLVIAAYVTAGFKVGYNWPYFGGRVTEQYGAPQKNHHALQVELNRALYMDESTKKLIESELENNQTKIQKALSYIQKNLHHL